MKQNGKSAQILNKLLSTTQYPGLGIRPRLNAKVNDLIYIAQGDADYKKTEYLQYWREPFEDDPILYAEPYLLFPYEEPYRLYYNPKLIPPASGDTHYLKHPETGKDLTRIE